MKHVVIATRYRELRDDSDEITRDDDEKTRETIAMRRGTCVTAKREK